LAVILAIWEVDRRIMVRGQPGQIVFETYTPPPHLQNNLSKMDWRRGSSGREPALQVQSPKLIQERVGNTLELVGIGKNFLNGTPAAQQLRDSIDKWETS
jgi:hypothetical protein